MKAMTQRISEWAIRYNWMLLVVMLVVRFVFQDRFWVTALLFYGTPFPVMIGFCGVCLCTYWRLPHARYVLGGIACALGIVWVNSSYKIRTVPTLSETSLTVLFWNIARLDEHPSSTLIQHLQTTPADIMGIVESGPVSHDALSTYQAAFPTHTIQRLSGGMLCLTTGTIQAVTYSRLPHKSGYNMLDIELDSTLYSVVIVDIGANPLFPRNVSLHALMGELPVREHMILMGDFNTPYESVFFHEYKQRYRHAFSEAGTGFAATWPYGFPLLQLDHIWTSRDMRPISIVKQYAILSDHARLTVTVEEIQE